MRNNLYSIYDTVAEEIIGAIFRANNDEVARRAFYEALADQQGPFAKNARDYQLLKIGSIETSDGAIHRADPVEVTASGADWLDANKENK